MFPRRFALVRHVDYTGVSGVGVVAYGVAFAEGQVALRWISTNPSLSVWDSLADVIAVHGHGQATSVEWIDEPADDSSLAQALEQHQAMIADPGARHDDATTSAPGDPEAPPPPPELPAAAPEPAATAPEPAATAPEPTGPGPTATAAEPTLLEAEPGPGTDSSRPAWPRPAPPPVGPAPPPATPSPPVPLVPSQPPAPRVSLNGAASGSGAADSSHGDGPHDDSAHDDSARDDGTHDNGPHDNGPRRLRPPGRHRRRAQEDSTPLRLIRDEPS